MKKALDKNEYTSETPIPIQPILRLAGDPGWAKEPLGNSRKIKNKPRAQVNKCKSF